MLVRPVGHRVLIRPEAAEEVTKGGIVIPESTKKAAGKAQVVGTILAIGESCWADDPIKNTTTNIGIPWCKVGDKVLYQRYSGMRVPDGKGDFREDMILLNDLDITGVVTEDDNTES